MYDIAVRKLAMRMVSQIGILKTSVFTNISRSTLWRWKRFGVDRKRRTFESKLFETSKDFLKAFLLSTQYTTATGIITFFKNVHNVRLSAKTVYRFIKLLGFTRKRSKVRGQSKGDLAPLVEYFCNRYDKATNDKKMFVSIDECGFSERLKPIYGYSPIGKPVILKTTCGWIHHSLLMAVYSDGHKTFMIKKGGVKKTDFTTFIESLKLSDNSILIMDNASIHKIYRRV
jgi:hypothetical protein